MVNEYSLKSDRNKQLSRNFSVYEFACKDKSDKILISEELVDVLQKIRDNYNKPVNINSAYRSVEYNKEIRGSSNSQHCKGTAADIWIEGCDPVGIALQVASLPYFDSHGGIGVYSRNTGVKNGFVHVDVRESKSRWLSKSGTSYLSTSNIMPKLQKDCKDGRDGVSYAVTILQRHIGGTVDGIFGENTRQRLMRWQLSHGLVADGIAGDKTWSIMV